MAVPRNPRRAALLATWCAAATLGCSATTLTRDMATAAPPAMIDATLASLADRRTQRMIVALLDSPDVHAAARTFAADLADGSLAVLSEPARTARVEALSEAYLHALVRAAGRTFAASLRDDLGPALAAVARSSAAAATEGAADGVQRSLGPALRGALRDPETAAAASALVRALAREAVIGSNEAMSEIQRTQQRPGGATFLGGMTSLAQGGVNALRVAGVALAAACAIAVAWAVRRALRTRRRLSARVVEAAHT